MKTFFKQLQRGWNFTWLVFFGIILWGNVTARGTQFQIDDTLRAGETSVIKFSINNDLLASANEMLWSDQNGRLYHMDKSGKVEQVFYSGNLGSYFQDKNIISIFPEQVLDPKKLSSTFQTVYFWKGLEGHYFQVGSNKNFWMSMDGRLWKISDSREWKGNGNTIYRLNTDNMRISRSNDNGRTWTLTQNNRWEGPTNQEYQMNENGRVQVRLLNSMNQGSMSTLPKTEMQLRAEENTTNWYNTNNWYDTNTANWTRAPSNQWPGNNRRYLKIQQGVLWESSVGASFSRSQTNWWVNSSGTYYKFDNSLNLWQSNNGNAWERVTPPYWVEGNYEYRLDTSNQVFYRIRNTYLDRSNWTNARSNQWQGNNGKYLKIQQGVLWESTNGASFSPSQRGWWMNNKGTYYKFDSSLKLWQSNDGQAWKQSTPPYWINGDYEYRLDTNNQVFYRKRF